MKREIARYVSECDACQRVKAIHKKSAVATFDNSQVEMGRYLDGLYSKLAHYFKGI
jgi:hypothetical protein